MAPISADVSRLVQALREPPPLLARLRGTDRRHTLLDQIAAAGEVRVVPALLTGLAFQDSLSEHAARTIAHLARAITPAQLAWIDEEARRGSWITGPHDPWWNLRPEAVSGLARTAGFDAALVGILASHPNGFVRAAALDQLALITQGGEIPFLAFRANDWVAPVAARATELLTSRLRPDNRTAVLEAFPFIVRTLRQRRRDHAEIARRLETVLLSDVETALLHAKRFDLTVRRFVYDVLLADGPEPATAVINSALADADVVIRARAIRRLGAAAAPGDAAAVLERLLGDDPVPAIRRLVLTMLSERWPARIAAAVPSALVDRAASVRELARFLVGTHRVPVVPHDLYVEHLTSTVPRILAAAIEGLGETGTRADVEQIARLLHADLPRVRRAALRALAGLDADGAIPLAIAALADDQPSVRSAAVGILRRNARRVEFDVVNQRLRTLANPRARQSVLRLLSDAPKWDAAAYLLAAFADSDDQVRHTAARLLDCWLADFNRRQTQPDREQLQRVRDLMEAMAPCISAKTLAALRFSIKAY